MRPQDIVAYSWRSLTRTSLRSYLTVIGIVIGVLAVVVITSISEGVQRDINTQLSAFGPDKMIIVPSMAGGRTFSGSAGPIQGATMGKLYQRDLDTIRSVSGIKSAVGGLMGRATIGYKGKTITTAIFAPEAGYFEQWSDYLTIDSGRVFNSNDRRVVVLGYDAATKMFGKDQIGVGNTLLINGKDYKVVGILKKIGSSMSESDDNSIYIPFQDGRDEFGSVLTKNEVEFISIQLLEGVATSDVQGTIEGKLANNHKVKVEDKDFTLVTSDYINQTIGTLLTTLSLFLLFITLIATFVGGIGIMNTMFMGVLERFQEIGILKAVGASQRDILFIFVVESGVLGFLGGLVGLVTGLLILTVVGAFGVPYWVRLRIFAFAFIFSAVIGIIAGIIPARQAAKLDPVDALRYE